MTFEYNHLFSHSLLSRAYPYANKKHVKNISIDDALLTANVEGTEIYQVTIHHENRKVISCECTCPFKKGFCKHAAAVLLFMDEQELKHMQNKMGSN